MGAMKAIYTDIQELKDAATHDEDSFINFIEDYGWTSPTENEIRASKASKLLAGLAPSERATALKVFDAVGVKMPAIDFPIRATAVKFGEQAPAA